jgi:hypothetical protein
MSIVEIRQWSYFQNNSQDLKNQVSWEKIGRGIRRMRMRRRKNRALAEGTLMRLRWNPP